MEEESVNPSVELPDYSIPIEDSDGYQPWYIVRKAGLSPICSICEVIFHRISLEKLRGTILITSIPIQERARGGCHLCPLFIADLEVANEPIKGARWSFQYSRCLGKDIIFLNL
jgi:hypothetical protein